MAKKKGKTEYWWGRNELLMGEKETKEEMIEGVTEAAQDEPDEGYGKNSGFWIVKVERLQFSINPRPVVEVG